jgi:hypothetical protein
MDGGRVLRALLTIRLARAQATRIASKVGQVLAVLLFLLGYFTSNPVLPFLAVFIFFAARSEEAHVVYEEQSRAVAQGAAAQGMWMAPPGYRWVHRGNGLWQLAPKGMNFPDQATTDTSAWRR